MSTSVWDDLERNILSYLSSPDSGPFSQTSTQGVDDIENAVQRIDQLCHHLKQHKRTLLEHRNRRLLVSRLPDELFSKIFHYLTPPFTGHIYVKSWLTFTHVCRAWRKIALEDPRLWMSPTFECPKFAAEMISRARNQPLHIRIHGYNYIDPSSSLADAIAYASKKAANIQELDARILYTQLQILLSSFPNANAPLLERFATEGLCIGDFLLRQAQRHPPILAPRLRNIVLRDVIFPFQVQPLKWLVELDIANNHGSHSGSIPIECFLPIHTAIQLLEGAPSLERLSLNSAMFPSQIFESEPGTAATPMVVAPKLRICTIRDSIKTTLRFLNRLEMPSIKKLSVTCTTTLYIAEAESVLKEVNRILSVPQRPSFHGLHIERYSRGLSICFFLSTASSDSPQPRAEIHMQLNHLDHAMFFSSTQRLLDLKTVGVVSMSAKSRRLDDEVWTTFSELPSLTHVCARNLTSAQSLIRALKKLCDDASENQAVIHPGFARLTDISLYDVYLEQSRLADNFLFDCMNTLKSCREVGNITLQNISLVGCNVPLEWIEELSAALPEVQVECYNR